MKTSILTLAILTVSPLLLTACVGAAVGAGATIGVAAAQDRGIGGAISDTGIRAQINDLWFKYDLETFSKLNLTVNEGRVLVTGAVQKPEARVEAIRLVWQVKGVREVINEVRVANSGGIEGYARDTWVSTRLRTELTFDEDVRSINYTIDTVQGIVYLMGVARNQTELNHVMHVARTIPDVKQVVSYVRMEGTEPAPLPAPAPRGALTQPAPENPYGGASATSVQSTPPGAAPVDSHDFGGQPAPLIPQPIEKQKIGGY